MIRMHSEKYGAADQGQQAQDIDDFHDLRRVRHSLPDYLIEFEHRYDHARTSSGFMLNDVGRIHLPLKCSMVDAQTKSNFRLLINKDLRRFDELYAPPEASEWRRRPRCRACHQTALTMVMAR